MTNLSKVIIALLLVVSSAPVLVAQKAGLDQYQRGPYKAEEAMPAPEWTVAEWIKGQGASLKELRGQVVVVDFFQLWCPGCNSFSIPLMAHWEKTFAEEIAAQKVKLVSIHTVFEGHSYQSNDRLKQFIKEKQMNHAVGVDKQIKGKQLPETMIDFDTRGTPEVAIIDKKGRIRFQKLGWFDHEWATDFIRELINEAGS